MTGPLKEAILERIRSIEEQKAMLGPLYNDYNLLFALSNGNPIDPRLMNRWLKKWLGRHPELAMITFHGLRHSGTTYKLMISGGDIKAVQGETGDKTAQMVTDRYAHVTESPRKALINKIDSEFYTDKSKLEPGLINVNVVSLLKQNPAMLKEAILAAMS